MHVEDVSKALRYLPGGVPSKAPPDAQPNIVPSNRLSLLMASENQIKVAYQVDQVQVAHDSLSTTASNVQTKLPSQVSQVYQVAITRALLPHSTACPAFLSPKT